MRITWFPPLKVLSGEIHNFIFYFSKNDCEKSLIKSNSFLITSTSFISEQIEWFSHNQSKSGSFISTTIESIVQQSERLLRINSSKNCALIALVPTITI